MTEELQRDGLPENPLSQHVPLRWHQPLGQTFISPKAIAPLGARKISFLGAPMVQGILNPNELEFRGSQSSPLGQSEPLSPNIQLSAEMPDIRDELSNTESARSPSPDRSMQLGDREPQFSSQSDRLQAKVDNRTSSSNPSSSREIQPEIPSEQELNFSQDSESDRGSIQREIDSYSSTDLIGDPSSVQRVESDQIDPPKSSTNFDASKEPKSENNYDWERFSNYDTSSQPDIQSKKETRPTAQAGKKISNKPGLFRSILNTISSVSKSISSSPTDIETKSVEANLEQPKVESTGSTSIQSQDRSNQIAKKTEESSSSESDRAPHSTKKINQDIHLPHPSTLQNKQKNTIHQSPQPLTHIRPLNSSPISLSRLTKNQKIKVQNTIQPQKNKTINNDTPESWSSIEELIGESGSSNISEPINSKYMLQRASQNPTKISSSVGETNPQPNLQREELSPSAGAETGATRTQPNLQREELSPSAGAETGATRTQPNLQRGFLSNSREIPPSTTAETGETNLQREELSPSAGAETGETRTQPNLQREELSPSAGAETGATNPQPNLQREELSPSAGAETGETNPQPNLQREELSPSAGAETGETHPQPNLQR
ncbi:hypothetical protein, partial [Roseofilum casamattae]